MFTTYCVSLVVVRF